MHIDQVQRVTTTLNRQQGHISTHAYCACRRSMELIIRITNHCDGVGYVWCNYESSSTCHVCLGKDKSSLINFRNSYEYFRHLFLQHT